MTVEYAVTLDTRIISFSNTNLFNKINTNSIIYHEIFSELKSMCMNDLNYSAGTRVHFYRDFTPLELTPDTITSHVEQLEHLLGTLLSKY